jgi:hypothetical protein
MARPDEMNARVEATRDDGAVMVTLGGAAAVVLPTRQITYLPKDSVYARGGGWTPAPQSPPLAVPIEVDLDRLTEADRRASQIVVFTDDNLETTDG